MSHKSVITQRCDVLHQSEDTRPVVSDMSCFFPSGEVRVAPEDSGHVYLALQAGQTPIQLLAYKVPYIYLLGH